MSLALLVCSFFPALAEAESEPKVFTQAPEVATSRVRGGEVKPTAEPTKKDRRGLRSGPAPVWIWGKDPNQRYVLRKEFMGDSRSAWLQATCDNRMTVYLNGKRMVQSSTWESPVLKNVQKYLKPGKNLLEAEVANAGGPSGFVLKLALTMPDGKLRHVISDKSWEAVEKRDAKKGVPVRTLAKMGSGAWGNVFSGSTQLARAPRGIFNVLPGFQVELLYTVPKATQGSWVCITVDPKGRVIASDQGRKGLFRITPPPIGGKGMTRVEPLKIKMSAAQGMLFAFDSLYFSVNGGPGSGFYRARDKDGDDQFEELVKLKPFRGGGEHGPHALRLAPDGKSIYVIAGNHTNPPQKFQSSRIPSNWGEDLLLPRQWDARGHARGKLAPGGWIARTDPEGQKWEIFSIGYRNPYDMDFNADGELFAYDADMEWDMGTPWYRPTRLVHATSGSEFGWRSGTGKWPTWYVDSLPQVVDIGPGSPVGVTFGYGTKFPAKYQKALYLCDWTFGTMYAIHLTPEGASYRGVREEFLSRSPLPLTDAAVGPDGALYFTVGGRGTQSALYRVTYVGKDSTAPVKAQNQKFAQLRALRRQLEQYHTRKGEPGKVLELVWPALSHADRHIRYAARVALEHQEVKQWLDHFLKEKNPQTLITASVALARQGDRSLQPQLLATLEGIDFARLEETQQLEYVRALSLVFIRMGNPGEKATEQFAQKMDAYYPANSDALNRGLCTLLCYLQSPQVIPKTIALMKKKTEPKLVEREELLARNQGYGRTIARMLANQPEIQKLHYAFALRTLAEGWTVEQRLFYYRWLQEARGRSGGASYQGFIANIEKEAWANTNNIERLAVEGAGLRKPFQAKALPKARGPGQDWTVEGVLVLASKGLKGRDFKNGKRTFAAARCIVCHRFDGEGGATGPDLTQLAGRFSLKDMTEAIVEPSKVISDRFRTSIVETKRGKVYTGQIITEDDDKVMMLIDPEDSTKVVTIRKTQLESKRNSPLSMMPKDLLKTLNKDEVLDLLAYLMSRGNPRDPMFRK